MMQLQVADRVARGGGVTKSKAAAAGAAAAVHEHFSHPNVLVAHLQEGIEVIHLYTGEVAVQKAPLPLIRCLFIKPLRRAPTRHM